MTDDFERDAERRQRQFETLDRLSQRFGASLSDAFSRNVAEGRRLDGVLQGLGRTLLSATLRAALQPLRGALGTGLAGLFGGGERAAPFARGGVFSPGRATPFAKGGVVAAPTFFPLGRSAGSGPGLMGERGAEAVMPLARGPDGRLGVSAGAGRPVSVTVQIQATDAESFRRSEAAVAASLARAVARGQRGM